MGKKAKKKEAEAGADTLESLREALADGLEGLSAQVGRLAEQVQALEAKLEPPAAPRPRRRATASTRSAAKPKPRAARPRPAKADSAAESSTGRS